MNTSMETQTIEAKCHCGSVHFTVDVPVTDLPLNTYLCHCSRCRYLTGTLAVIHTRLSQGVEPNWIAPSSDDNLMTYHPANSCYRAKSCKTCGCHVGVFVPNLGIWVLATTLFTKHDCDVVDINSNIFTNSSPDGGLASILTHIKGQALPSWCPEKDGPGLATPSCELMTGADGQQRLRAQCQCGGVSISIPRPPAPMAEDPLADKLVSPVDGTKWYGTLDLCDDCRLVNGTPAASWIFVPLNLIEPPVGEDLRVGTSKTYASSEGVTRAFCSVCSATVFFLKQSRRYNDVPIVDIATGLLRAPEGAMAEDWITWRAQLSFEEDGERYDKDLAEGLITGMKQWTAMRDERAVDKH